MCPLPLPVEYRSPVESEFVDALNEHIAKLQATSVLTDIDMVNEVIEVDDGIIVVPRRS